jgi:hypothetical protein
MRTNYKSIADENLVAYGTQIDRIGELLLAKRYSDRTHFVFELLQNAEDALSWRAKTSSLPRSVRFDLRSDHLDFSHYGLLFEEKHVRAICGIGESTKAEELTTIGRFGIGFKSVYAFTKRPEIHSGNEHFAIDSFVWPKEIAAKPTQPGQTLFHLPFQDSRAFPEILQRLKILGHRTLLFLKEIETIEWHATGTGGTYFREVQQLGPNVRKVTLLGEPNENPHLKLDRWLIFSRDVFAPDGKKSGSVEVAYALKQEPKGDGEVVIPVQDSDLVVFFPTETETHLGFLVQGPYRTTPSRDNVPKDDDWNRKLVLETAALVKESLRWMRDNGRLTISLLNAMPLDASKFIPPVYVTATERMFKPVFEAVKNSLQEEDLLPCYGSGFVAGKASKIARTEALRTLLSPLQLAALCGTGGELHWVTEQITRDKAPELRDYLMAQLQMEEVEPETVLKQISEPFLQKQSDEWIAELYAFLLDQPALWRHGGFRHKSILRLEDDTQVAPFDDKGRARAFLPGPTQSGFPTVKAAICKNPSALKFLELLGLTQPDPVDDVIINVLPPFTGPTNTLTDDQYSRAFNRILDAFQTDSTSRRDKLVNKLRELYFVRSRNAKTCEIQYRLPGSVYFPAERLTTVFRDCSEIWFADDYCAALKGEAPRKLLEACGIRDYLRRIAVEATLDWQEALAIRRTEGHLDGTWGNTEDYDVDGLASAAKRISTLPLAEAEPLASTLWQILLHTLREARESFFQGSYTWGYFKSQWTAPFPAKFVKSLRAIPWLPGPGQTPKLPGEICFSALPKSISGSPSPALQALLGFKPEVIQQLADQVGVDPSVIDLVKKHGLTEDKLLHLLRQAGLENKAQDAEPPPAPSAPPAQPKLPTAFSAAAVAQALIDLLGPDAASPTPPPPGLLTPKAPGGSPPAGNGSPIVASRGNRGGGSQDRKRFTFIYVRPGDNGNSGMDSDEIDRREKVGREGVDAVLEFEKQAGRNPTEMDHFHEGYDIESRNAAGVIERFIEVKSISGAWGQGGVTLSQPQFKAAQELKDRFWLYVVANAGTPFEIIYRIQNPALLVRSFVYDYGWQALAEANTSA